MANLTTLQQAQLALVKLGEKPARQAEAFAAEMTDAELLAAASCHVEGDKLRLLDLLEHIATRQAMEADLASGKVVPQAVATPDDGTDLEDTIG